MMAEWSSDVRGRINGIEQGLAETIGLQADMLGDVFEDRLGLFLEWKATLPLVRKFEGFGGSPPGSTNQQVQQWLSRNEQRASAILETIHLSLYENFNASRLDHDAVTNAYSSLLKSIMRFPEEEIVFATTNYDTAIEIALEALKIEVRDGFERATDWATPSLRPDGVVALCREMSTSKACAVLHLHGAVGWYRASDDRIVFHHPDMSYNASLGIPALLLPDPNKDPSRHVGVDAIWAELDGALETATHILVIGHSLNDRHLVSKLRANSVHARLAVGVLSPAESEKAVMKQLPGARVVKLEFASPISADMKTLSDWAEGVA